MALSGAVRCAERREQLYFEKHTEKTTIYNVNQMLFFTHFTRPLRASGRVEKNGILTCNVSHGEVPTHPVRGG